MAPSLYEALGLTAAATQAEIKKAYHGLCLRLHPDKNPGDESAHDKFQALQRVYAVLGDPEKRKVYDETGLDGDEVEGLTGDQFDKLYKYYREVYAELTVDDIQRYEQTYRGSAEEAQDLRELYSRFGGDMKQVFSWLCCSRPEVDSHRFLDTLQQAVDKGELAKSKKFEQWAKQVTRKPAPANPLEAAGSDAGGGAGGDASLALVAAIRGRGQQNSSFLDALAEKYCGAVPKRGGKREEPSADSTAAKARKRR